MSSFLMVFFEDWELFVWFAWLHSLIHGAGLKKSIFSVSLSVRKIEVNENLCYEYNNLNYLK